MVQPQEVLPVFFPHESLKKVGKCSRSELRRSMGIRCARRYVLLECRCGYFTIARRGEKYRRCKGCHRRWWLINLSFIACSDDWFKLRGAIALLRGMQSHRDSIPILGDLDIIHAHRPYDVAGWPDVPAGKGTETTLARWWVTPARRAAERSSGFSPRWRDRFGTSR